MSVWNIPLHEYPEIASALAAGNDPLTYFFLLALPLKLLIYSTNSSSDLPLNHYLLYLNFVGHTSSIRKQFVGMLGFSPVALAASSARKGLAVLPYLPYFQL